MSFFDDSHITGVGMQGSAGPAVGFGEMLSQSFRQQFRVDSARALDDELRNRWLESLRAAQIPDADQTDPFDPYAYRAFAQHVQGRPIDVLDANRPLFGEYDPTARIRGMIDANERIRALNNPEIQTFEQILAEVEEMQRSTEERTASMSERSSTLGGTAASLLGAIGGSFTTRDPLNLITATIGAGRTVATRIASEMALAAGVTGYTELAEVAPAREIVGLPERNPLFNIAAATIGAGVIRGGIEGIGYGISRLRARENMAIDLRDSQLQQMFSANESSPSARAGAQVLDDVGFFERNNPYGEGRAAQERFIAEIRQVQRVMGGEPMTAIARVLPPLPYEFIQKEADFVLVREQSPETYARMEAAQTRLRALQTEIAAAERAANRATEGTSDALERVTKLVSRATEDIERTSDESFADTAALMARYADEALPNESREDFVVRKTREETAVRFEGDVDEDAARLAAVRGTEQPDLGPQKEGIKHDPDNVIDLQRRLASRWLTQMNVDPRLAKEILDTDISFVPQEFIDNSNRFGVDQLIDIMDRLERGEAVDLAEELRKAGQEYPANDPNAPLLETIKAKPGVKAGRLIKMLGPQLYGDMRNMGSVSIKEILQNSFDAIKTVQLRRGGKGRIEIVTNKDTREIQITDNGVGMTPETLGTKFLEIAGTGKEEGAASGGFGVAKVLFLYGNEDLRVISMRDGQVSEMVTSGPELSKSLEDPSFAPNIEVRDATEADLLMFPDGSGTQVTLKIPESFRDPATGDNVEIDFPSYEWEVPSLNNSPLFADIDVRFNGYEVPIGSAFPIDKFQPFSNIDFGWGNARIYVSRESEKMWSNNVHILSNGIHQFSQKMSKKPLDPYSGVLPYEFYIDIAPKVTPDEPGYPFNLNRQSFTEEAKRDLNKVLSYINALYAFNDMAKSAESFGTARFFSDNTGQLGPYIDLKPTIKVENKFVNAIKPGDEVFIRDGRMYVNGRELPELKADELKEGIPSPEELKVDPHLIDPDRVMVHDNVMLPDPDDDFGGQLPFYTIMRKQFGEGIDDFLYNVGDVFRQLRLHVKNVLGYDDLGREAIGLSFDPEYRGVSIRLPFSGSFINPFLPESDNLAEAAYGLFGTMVHELAHHKVRSHNEAFPQEMQRIWYKLQANQGEEFVRLQEMLLDAVMANEEVFRGGRELLQGGDAKVAGNRLGGVNEDPNATGGPEGIPDRNAPGGPEGVGPDRVPAGPDRGVEPPEPRRIARGNAAEPTTLEQLRQMYRDANKAYQDAYRQVEAEAARLRSRQSKIETEQQNQAVNIFSQATLGRTFNWSSLEYDHVGRLVDEINAFNDTLDEKAIARFTRETVGEGEEAVEREVWRVEGGIDIGLKTPVDPEFRISTDDGDMSIEAAMRDLQDDADLDEAMKVCKI